MQLTDFVRDVPDDIRSLVEPILPPAVWQGDGRKPIDNRLLYVLASDIGWEYLPAGFPHAKTARRRLRRRRDLDCFHTTWRLLARRYQRLHGINWARSSSTAPTARQKKGATRPAPSR